MEGRNNTQIYHITCLENLQSIITSGGILCKNAMTRKNIACINIAHQNIQNRRAAKKIPIGPEGTLHDYVPFYFAPRSPMLYAIHKGNVPGYSEGQEPIIYLVSNIGKFIASGGQFVFTDGHAIMDITRFYEDPKDIDQIDWSIMRNRMWKDTQSDGDRSRRRQAEFLAYDFFCLEDIIEIGVINKRNCLARVDKGAIMRI